MIICEKRWDKMDQTGATEPANLLAWKPHTISSVRWSMILINRYVIMYGIKSISYRCTQYHTIFMNIGRWGGQPCDEPAFHCQKVILSSSNHIFLKVETVEIPAALAQRRVSSDSASSIPPSAAWCSPSRPPVQAQKPQIGS